MSHSSLSPIVLYFFTAAVFRRVPWFTDAVAVEALRQAVLEEMGRRPFLIDAMVILPDHIHAIWTLPGGDADYPTRWRNIKRAFTARVPPDQRPAACASRRHKKEQAIWQRRFGSIG